MGQSVYSFVDLCVISLGLNDCGTWWEDRNQAGQKPQTIGVLFRKLSPVPMSSRLFPHFLFYQIQCIWFYVVFYPLGLDGCSLIDTHLFAFFYM